MRLHNFYSLGNQQNLDSAFWGTEQEDITALTTEMGLSELHRVNDAIVKLLCGR